MRKLQRIPQWYFTGAITVVDQSHLPFYRTIISVLKEFGKVPTEHIGYDYSAKWWDENRKDKNVYAEDFRGLDNSIALVADITLPTTGGGAEIDYKVRTGAPVLCVFEKGKEVSKYITHWSAGKTAKNLTVESYENKEQLENIVRTFASGVLNKHPPLAGAYIVLEGGEGSGKTTQRWQLVKHLREQGYDVEEAREPGGTKIAESIRKILQDPELEKDDKISPMTELFLFEAARSPLVTKKIIPALGRGAIFASDRCFWSTIAYQGFGRDTNIPMIDILNNIAIAGIKPDLGIIIDVPPEVGLAKITKTEFGKADRFEQEKIDFHHRVLDGYRFVASREPNTVLLQYVDGIENMQAIIREKVDVFLKENFKET